MSQQNIHDLDSPLMVDEDKSAEVTAEAKDYVRENEDGSKSITLKYPPTVRYRRDNKEREELFEEIRIRRANGGDLRALLNCGQNEEKMLITLFTRLTGDPAVVFDHLDLEDVDRFTKEVEGFLPKHPIIGKN